MSVGTTAVKPPIRVSIEVDKRWIPVWGQDNDGYISQLAELERVSININIDPDYNIWGFSVDGVDGNKNITPVKNYLMYTDKGKNYRKIVPIHRNKGEIFTLYNENNIRLLEMKEDGYFAVYEVAMVFQNGRGFLTTQRVYEGFAYRNGLSISCPEFNDKWSQLVKFMNDVYPLQASLPEIYKYVPEPETTATVGKNLADGVGKVKWFNVAQGFGAIFTNKGEAFVHYKDINSGRRLICPTAGEEVLFDKLIPNNSNEGFSYKAVDVIAT